MAAVTPLARSMSATVLCAAFAALAVVASPSFAQTPIRGFADLHSHQFANLAFGGWAVTGSPYGPASEELSEEKDSHHSWRHRFDVMGGILAGYGGPIDYGNDGAPSYGGWPSFFEVSHQKVHQEFLYRAVRGGLRLMVMYAVESASLCKSVGRPADKNCDDIMSSIYQQLDAAYAMQDSIDAEYGGAGRGWYRIVTTPAQARTVMQQGKLAVVLGVETSYLFDCKTTPCDWERPLKQLWDAGVRSFFPVHHDTNTFAGASFFRVPLQVPSDRATEVLINPANMIALSIMSSMGVLPYTLLTQPCAYDSKSCNIVGLTPTGRALVRRLMQLGAIVDIDHMSDLAVRETLTMAEGYSYPVVASHAGFNAINVNDQDHEGQLTDDEFRRIRDLGGMIGLITNQGALADVKTHLRFPKPVVPHVCGNTTETFAQAYYYALDHGRGMPIALGTDFNGPLRQVGPRFGGLRCNGGLWPVQQNTKRLAYPYVAGASGQSMSQQTIGSRIYDFNVDGLAHAGLLPDMIADLRNLGVSSADLDPLYKSADGYLKMWERIETAKAGVPESFETADLAATPWSIFSEHAGFEAATSTLRPRTGSWSLVQRNTGGIVYRDFGGLQPGQTYLVSAWVATDSGSTASAKLSIHDTAEGGYMETAGVNPGPLWTRVSLLFTANATRAVRVHLVRFAGSGSVFWDDVHMLEAPVNGTFERGSLGNWATFNTEEGPTASVEAIGARSGRYAASQLANGIIFQDFHGLTPGTTYVIAAWVAASPGAAPRGQLSVHNTGEGNFRQAFTSPGSAWQQVSLLYTADASGSVRIHLVRDGGTGGLMWDDVTVTRGVPNGGAENGGAGWWTYSPDPKFRLNTSLAAHHSGSMSFRESLPGVIWRDIGGLIPGRTYAVSVWMAGSKGATARAELSVHDTQGNNFAQKFLAPATTWQPLKLAVVANQAGSLRIHLVRHEGIGDVYWDDVDVMEVPALSVNQLIYNAGVNRWSNLNLTSFAAAVPPVAGSSVTMFNNGWGQHVIYTGADQHVYQLISNPTSWVAQDLTGAAGGGNAARDTRLASFDNAAGEHVFYVGVNGHVQQLFYSRSANRWFDQDLTALTGGVGPRAGTPLAALNSSKGEHVFYVGANHHLYELHYSSNGGKWAARDLTVDGASALVSDGSSLATFENWSGIHVFFTGTDAHIRQLIFDTAGRWVGQDLTAFAAGPLALPSSSLSAFNNDAGEHLVYVAQDSRIHQLVYSRSTGRWVDQNLTNLAKGKAPSLDSAIDTFVNRAVHVVYVGNDRRVYQMIYDPSAGKWTTQDLTAIGNGVTATTWQGLDTFVNTLGEYVFYISSDVPIP